MPAVKGLGVGGATLWCFVLIAISNLLLLDPLFLDIVRRGRQGYRLW